MIRGRKSRSNKAQIRALVDFMLANNHLATGEYAGPLGAKRANAQWLKLKEILKNYGPDRSVEQWKQTWKDLKKSARQENALCTQALQQDNTGYSTGTPTVSEISKKILDTIGQENSTGTTHTDSAVDPDSRTEAQLKKCWEVKKSALDTETTGTLSQSLEKSVSNAKNEEYDNSSDPLMQVKQEVPIWNNSRDEDSDSASKEFEAAEEIHKLVAVSLGAAASPAHESRLAGDEFPYLTIGPRGLDPDDRSQERIEELHKLKVEEQIWMLKTIRERHATAQLERERAQLEQERAHLEREKAKLERLKAQEESEKAKLEREKARFERDTAEFLREKALLELDRSKRKYTENNL